MAPINNCWICSRPVYKKLDCVCGLSWHLTCVNKGSHNVRLINGENGLKVFETVCPECFDTEADKKRWYSGEHFQPISKEVFNELLEFILLAIRKEAPQVFFWSADNFVECGRKTIDIKLIEKRVKEKYYESPKCFFNDIYLIYHNLVVMVENPHRFPQVRRPYSVCIQLDQFSNRKTVFKRFIDYQMRLLTDCPHCVNNAREDKLNWLTMVCPWGHPLILASIGGKKQLAKMLKFNRESKRVDVILLATEERHRVDADECRIPSSSDLLTRSVDGSEARRAKNLANTYVNRMQRKFKKSIEFGKERKPLWSLESHYYEKPSPAVVVDINENEVIDLIDDDESIASNAVSDEDSSENRTKFDLQKDENDSPKKENDSPCEEIASSNSSNGDVVIDEVLGGASPEEQDTDFNMPNIPSLTTVVERLSNSAIDSQATIVENSASTLAPTPTRFSTSTVPQSQMNLSPTLDSKTSSKVKTTPIPSPPDTSFIFNDSDCQFTIEPDDGVEEQSANVTDEFTDSHKTTNSQDILPAPNFVVEDESEVWPSNQDVTTIPSARFLLTPDEKGATSTIDFFPNVSISPHSYIESVSTMSSSEVPPLKKLKTSHDSKLTEYEFQIKRLEQQLEFAIKDKELNSRQIDNLREQIISMYEKERKNSIEMEELQFKIVRLEEQNTITTKSNDDFNKKLLKLMEEKINLERKLDQKKTEWEERLSKELKDKDDQHSKEKLNKMDEIMSLNKQLKDNDKRYQKLKQAHNTVVSKYQHLKKRFLSIVRDINDDNFTPIEDTKHNQHNNNEEAKSNCSPDWP